MSNTIYKNPCFCITTCGCAGTSSKPSTEPLCPDGKYCLKLCDGVVASKDAVGPCGKEGALDLLTLSHDFDCCKALPKISVFSYSNHFLSAYVDGTTLYWRTSGAEYVGEYGEIILKLCCNTEDGDTLEYFSCQRIGVKDLCKCSGCEECETCDPCSGDCVKNDIDLSINPV